MGEGFGLGFFLHAILLVGTVVFFALHIREAHKAIERAEDYAEKSGRPIRRPLLLYYQSTFIKGFSFVDRMQIFTNWQAIIPKNIS